MKPLKDNLQYYDFVQTDNEFYLFRLLYKFVKFIVKVDCNNANFNYNTKGNCKANHVPIIVD